MSVDARHRIDSKNFAIANKFGTDCEVCGRSVPEGEGYSSKTLDGDWFTVCHSKNCVEAANLGDDIGDDGDDTPDRRVLDHDGQTAIIDTPYEPDNLPLMRAAPGASWDGDANVWRVSDAPGDRRRLLEIADELELDVTDAYLEASEPSDAAERSAERDPRLYDFQRTGAKWLRDRDGALLAWEMGLGKTIGTLAALPEGASVLAVVPANVKYNWADEAREWRPDFDVGVCEGYGSVREPGDGEIVVCNFDILPGEPVGEGGDWVADLDGFGGLDVLVVDEAHKCKNREAHRTQRVKALSGKADKVWGLTGTPMLNDPLDLWGVLSALRLGWEAYDTWGIFKEAFDAHKDRWGGLQFGTPSEEAAARLRRVTYRLTRDEALPELPDKVRRTVEVPVGDGNLEADLDELWEAWKNGELTEGAESDGDDEPTDRLPPFERISEVRRRLADARVDHVEQFADQYEANDEPLVVFSAHRAPVDALGERDGWETITGDTPAGARTEIVEAFQAGELDGVAGTIGAAKEGITLTEAHHVLFADLGWRPADNEQAEDRVTRIGQEADHVQVTRLVSDHPLDRRVVELLEQKREAIEATVDRDASGGEPEPSSSQTDGGGPDGPELVDEDDERWRERVEANAPEPVDDATRARILEAIDRLERVCDGAQRKDGVGFNKHDAGRAPKLYAAVERGDDAAAHEAIEMLQKYHRQIGGDFPDLVGDGGA